jgi:hypothetical protein
MSTNYETPLITNFFNILTLPHSPNILFRIMFVTAPYLETKFHTCIKTTIKPAWNILIPMLFDRMQEYMARTKETRKAHKILVKNPQRKAKNRRKDNIRIALTQTRCKSVKWIHLVQDRVQ